jgi:hypothetical protein
VKVAADAQLGDVNFVGTKYFAGSANGVILRMIEIENVINVGPYFWSKEFRIESRLLGSRIAIQPGPIAKANGAALAGFSAGFAPSAGGVG